MNGRDFAFLDAEEKMRRTAVWLEGDSHEFWAYFNVRNNMETEDLKRLGLTWLVETKEKWYQVGVGTFQEVGEDHGRPVCISIFWYLIDGVPVGVWEPASQIVNHELIEKFLKKYGAFRRIKYANLGWNTFDYNNIGNARNFAVEVSKAMMAGRDRDSEDPYLFKLDKEDKHLRYLAHFDWFNPHHPSTPFPERS